MDGAAHRGGRRGAGKTGHVGLAGQNKASSCRLDGIENLMEGFSRELK